jgi:MSHA biogenesis protein MshO
MKTPNRESGVSLVELVVVLTIIGLIASLSATLVTRVASSQQDNRGRLKLAQAADSAIARIADELQTALPNSLRVTSNAAGVWIEWVPVADAGRYRRAGDTVAASAGDMLDLDDASDTGFDIIGTPLASLGAGQQLVIQNLGTPEADAYGGANRRAGLVLAAGGRALSFTAAGALPQSTDSRRFFIVSTPVTLGCVPAAGGGFELRRYSGYGWLAAQPVAPATLSAADSALALSGLSACAASYSVALANIGLLNLRLTVQEPSSGALMSFLQQLPVDNTP